MELANLIIKILIVFCSATSSQIAFEKRNYPLGVLCFGIFATFFRLSFIRAATAYAGVFSHENLQIIDHVYQTLTDASVANVTDIIMLASVLYVFIWMVGIRWTKKIK